MSTTQPADDRDTLYAMAHRRPRVGDLQGTIELLFELLARNLRDHDVTRALAAPLA